MVKIKTRFPIGSFAQFRQNIKTVDVNKQLAYYKKFPPQTKIGRQNLKALLKEKRKRMR